MAKIRVIIGFVLFFPVLLASVVYALIPGSLLRLLHARKAADRWTDLCARFSSNALLFLVGVKVTVDGRENLPKDTGRVCYIANHQSDLDIPSLFGKVRIFASIITKIELKKVPILNWWCNAMHCIYIDRKSARSSVKAILSGIDAIKAGQPAMVFPEGTRSKTGKIAEFKAGSFKLATRPEAIIVPICIWGTRYGLENRKRFGTVHAYLSVLPPIDTAGMDEEAKNNVHLVVQEAVMRRYDELAKQHG
jgi:1-acyl-sn-glycerol-3-phosphate acyltransferase